MKDDLGDRMKSNYEDRTRYYLPRRTNTIIRLDGKAFHSFTRNLKKPFDYDLIEAMNYATLKLCENIQGAVLGYTQSDEISILLQDYKKITTDAWFDGNIQKITSISASMCTAYFNDFFKSKIYNNKWAIFDSRVFVIPDIIEVENYFIWRQKDCVRNSISMLAQSLYSHKELNKKSQSDMQEMIFQKGENWNDEHSWVKRGRFVVKYDYGWNVQSKTIDILKNREEFTNLIKTEKE